MIIKALHKKKWTQLEFNRFPRTPGCYIMKNSSGKVIYVGKAKNLYKRVRSYFYKKHSNEKNKIRKILRDLQQIEFRICKTEIEALILESRLIKTLQPEYNRQLRKFKSYSFIKITLSNPYPRIYQTKNVSDDGNYYYGPFEGNYTLTEEVELINKIFKTRPCHQNININPDETCFYNQIKQCLAPCTGKTKKGQYKNVIYKLIHFLETGESSEVDQYVSKLNTIQQDCVRNMQFEQAEKKWRQIQSIESIRIRYPFLNRLKDFADSLIIIEENHILSAYHLSNAVIQDSFTCESGSELMPFIHNIQFQDKEDLFSYEKESPAFLHNKENLDEIKILIRYLDKHQGRKLLINPDEFKTFQSWYTLNSQKENFQLFSYSLQKLNVPSFTCRD